MRKQIPRARLLASPAMPYWTHRHRRLHRCSRGSRARRPSRDDARRVARAERALVRVRTFLPHPARPRRRSPPREMWNIGGETSPAYQARVEVRPAALRLLPYIYSLAGAVTQDGGTMHAPAGDGFPRRCDGARADRRVHVRSGVPGQPRSPTYKARSRSGLSAGGGRLVRLLDRQARRRRADASTAAAPFDRDAGLHVRAGSIVPIGPELQYIGEKPADADHACTSTPAPTAASRSTKTTARQLRLRTRRVRADSDRRGTTRRGR